MQAGVDLVEGGAEGERQGGGAERVVDVVEPGQGQGDRAFAGRRAQREARGAHPLQHDVVGADLRVGARGAAGVAVIAAQVAEVDRRVFVGVAAATAVLGVRRVLELGQRQRVVVDTEVRRAAALALALGATLDHVDAGLHAVSAAFGRAETLRIAGRELSILLVKNPAGANEVLRTLTLEDGQIDLWLALNDKIADGRDVSWIWDADFELLAGRVRRVTCSGTRAEEMALRLKYAGVGAPIAVERDLGRSLDMAVADGGGPLYALPTYTALLEVRELLAERGLAKRWSD